MKIHCLAFVWFLKATEITNAEWVQLITVTDQSTISLVDLWYNSSVNSSITYSRKSLIDVIDNSTEQPVSMRLQLEDAHYNILAGYRFNYTGSTSNLSSWIDDGKLESKNTNAPLVFRTIMRNDTLLIASNHSEEVMYVVTEPLNGTDKDQFIAFTKTVAGFSRPEGISLTEGQDVFFTTQNLSDVGFTNVTIYLGTQNGYQYVNGIIVQSQNTSVNFTIGYNNGWDEACNITHMHNLSNWYTFRADGQLNVLKSSIRVICLWIFFDDVIYDYKITLTEPDKDFVLAYRVAIFAYYDDPTTTSATNTSITTVASVTSENTTDCDCPPPVENKYSHLAGLTHEELVEALKEETDRLKRELTVDTKQLSSTIRKKTSATDVRPSSASIGSLGLVFLILAVLLFIVGDLTRLPSCIREIVKQFNKLKIKIKATKLS